MSVSTLHAADWIRAAPLAEYVDVDARLFLEVSDVGVLRDTPAGEALGAAMTALVAQVKTAPPDDRTTQPTGELTTTAAADAVADNGDSSEPSRRSDKDASWQNWFAAAIGLEGEPAAGLLLDGRFAIAADGWRTLSSVIFLARPTRIDLLEERLAQRIEPATRNQRVRRYNLDRRHELACDGQVVIVGPRGQESDLYGRTVNLLASDQGLCLADLAEFRDRLAEISADAQIVLYLGSNRRRTAIEGFGGLEWLIPAQMMPRSVVLSLEMTDQGMRMEARGRLPGPGIKPARSTPPVEELLFLPAATIAAWTQPVDYLSEFQQLKGGGATSLSRIFIELLEWQLPEGGLERRLFGRLTGDSVFMVGQVQLEGRHEGRLPGPSRVPTLGLWVETKDQGEVDACLQQVAHNIARLMNLQGGQDAKIDLREELADERGTVVRWMPLERLVPAGTAREFFGSVELSWAVVDGWLIAATHHETVRQAVLARCGEAPSMPVEAVRQALSREDAPHRLPDTVLVAQPDLAAMLIDSWMSYVRAYHPEMLQPRWWHQIRRRYEASQVQLGIVPTPMTKPGEVEVGQVLSDYPAQGRLESGDRIIAVDGQRLHADQPVQTLRDALANRVHEQRITLTILRPGREGELAVEVPMSAAAFPTEYLQPLSLLEHVADLARHFAFASYTSWQPAPDRIRTRLDLRMAAPEHTAASSPRTIAQPDNAGTR